jgi:hypothetical protein
MLVARQAKVHRGADDHHDERGDYRQSTRPWAGFVVPALVEDVIHARTPKRTLTAGYHDTLAEAGGGTLAEAAAG